MGSFSISCRVSGQVIAEGDKCTTVPIIQNSTFGLVNMLHKGENISMYGTAQRISSPGSNWEPRGSFISGTYSDSCVIELDDTPTNRIALFAFFKDLVAYAPIVMEGENSSRDLPFDINNFINEKAPEFKHYLGSRHPPGTVDPSVLNFSELTAIWEYVWTVSRTHRLFMQDSNARIRPLQFSTFHKITFDYLIQYANTCKQYDGSSFELSEILTKTTEDFSKEFTQLSKLLSESTQLTRSDIKGLVGACLRTHLCLGLSQSTTSLLAPFANRQRGLLQDYVDGQMSFNELVAQIRPTMDGIYALKGMDELNLKFAPMVYGGQDYHNSSGEAFANFVVEVSRDISQERKNRYAGW